MHVHIAVSVLKQYIVQPNLRMNNRVVLEVLVVSEPSKGQLGIFGILAYKMNTH